MRVKSVFGVFLSVVLLAFYGCKASNEGGDNSGTYPAPVTYSFGDPPVFTACPSVSGDPSVGVQDSLVLDGYTDKQSYGAGDAVRLFLNGRTTIKTRIGVYDLNGMKVDDIEIGLQPQTKPESNAFQEGYGYCYSHDYIPPLMMKSGVYLIAKKIPFVYRSGPEDGDIAVVYPTNTTQAYNAKGGGSLYVGAPLYPEVSFLRPTAIDTLSSGEGFLRWALDQPVELRNRFRYLSDHDLDDYTRLKGAKLIIIIGHSEYWSRQARLNFDRFVDSGHHALVLSGNTMWWQVRYGKGGTSLFCYRSDSVEGRPDPEPNPLLQTVRWYEPWLAYPILDSIGADFRYARYQKKAPLPPYQPFGGYKIVHGNSPLLTGTGLKGGDILPHFSTEWDGIPLLGFGSSDDNPVINRSRFNPYRVEIVGFEHTNSDYASVLPSAEVYAPVGTAGTWVVWQKAPLSGFIVNVAANFWTTQANMSTGSGDLLRQITYNMVDVLANGRSPFSTP